MCKDEETTQDTENDTRGNEPQLVDYWSQIPSAEGLEKSRHSLEETRGLYKSVGKETKKK